MSRIVGMNTIRKPLLPALAVAASVAALILGSAAPGFAAGSGHLSGLTLKLDASAVYPLADGYRDTLGISISKAGDGASALPGSITVKQGAKTISTFPIGDTHSQSFVWDGRVGGKIVPGDYTVSATVIGPNQTLTRHETVTVSAKELVTQWRVLSFSAKDFFEHHISSTGAHNACTAVGSGLSCT
jgi:hypothetical protein